MNPLVQHPPVVRSSSRVIHREPGVWPSANTKHATVTLFIRKPIMDNQGILPYTLPQSARRSLIRLLDELPRTLLAATHDMRLVDELFPRTIVMDGGRIVAGVPCSHGRAADGRATPPGLRCRTMEGR